MPIEVRTDLVSIVMVGSFNPRILQPYWFAHNGLISEDDAADAGDVISIPEYTRFTAAGIFIEVQSDRFLARCESIHKERVKDLALSTFGEHLPHTPICSLGINRSFTVDCGSEKVRDQFGSLLAPKSPWGEWGSAIESGAKAEKHGGMVRLIMRQEPRPDGFDGYVQTDLRPNLSINTVVLVDVNDHYTVAEPEEVEGCQKVIDIIDSNWKPSMSTSETILDGLIGTIRGIES